MGLLDRVVLGTMPFVPRPIMRRLAARYIAGETAEEAIEVLAGLARDGFAGVVDVLGEDIDAEAEARDALGSYKLAADLVAQNGLDVHVSVKPTHFGLRLSPDLAHDLYAELVEHCRRLGQFVRVEMEDHTTTDATLEIFARLRERFENVGIVLQSRLLRTLDDIDGLGDRPLDVRLVKGIYLEPAAIAHTSAQDIRDAFVVCAERLFKRGHTVALATHDEHMAGRLLRLANDRGVAHERYYFEVLLGVQEALWRRWKDAGSRVRVYVPYGPLWRSYSQRRLRSNPELLRHTIRGLLTGK